MELTRQIEDARLRRETMSRLVAFLASNTADPATVGTRVIILDFFLNGGEDRRQRDLANKLGISEARASAAVKFWRKKIPELQGFREGCHLSTVKFSSRPKNPE